MRMEFQNEIDFVEGSNVVNSVRRGVKWAGRVPEQISLQTPTKNYKGIIVNRKVKRFCDIEMSDLRNNFEKKCRRPGVLFRRMKEIYPDFDGFEIVTLIDVEVLE